MPAERIKDCPFCGYHMDDDYDSQCRDTGFDFEVESRYIVCCPNCIASTLPENTWEKALANWNRRVDINVENINSLQLLKAEIAALVASVNTTAGGYSPYEELCRVLDKLRQLSAV